MKRVFVLFSFIFVLFSCNKTANRTSTLRLADSLGWQDSEEYYFSQDCSINCRDSKLFILDATSSKMSIFDEETLKFEKSFGKPGKAPGEFNYPLSFTFDNDGNIVIADLFNSRIQWLRQDGQYIKSVKLQHPAEVYNFNGNLYYSDLAGKPEINLYKLVEDNPVIDLSITDLIFRLELPKESNKRFAVAKIDDKTIISFLHLKDKILEVNSNMFFETPSFIGDYVFISCFVIDDNRLYIVQYSLDKDLSKTITKMIEDGREEEISSNLLAEEGGLKTYLVEYSIEGKVLNTYKFPISILGKEFSFAKSGSNIYLQDVFSGMIYKFVIQE